jgi:nucleoside-diphosphate-sugar epimerase
MKFLVTGVTGFVGANLVRALIREPGAAVYITARSTSNFWRIEDVLSRFKQIYFLDLADREAVFQTVQEVEPEVIFHLACYGTGVFELDKDLMLKANLSSTVNLLDAAATSGVGQFINTGSSSEYGMKNEPMRETDYCEPINFYGITKLAATNYCTMIGRLYHYRVCTLRLFSPYGMYQDPAKLYPNIINALSKGKAPHLSNPDFVRDFIPIDQVIDIYRQMITLQYAWGDIINVGSGKQQTFREFYLNIAAELGLTIEPVWGKAPARSYEPKHWEADITKLQSLLHPNGNLENGGRAK